MKITNKHKMPDLLYNALAEKRDPVEGEIHVTQLIGPPMLDYLKRKHWDELEVDASTRLWALMGQGMHAAIANDGRLQYAKAVLTQLTDTLFKMDLDNVLCVLKDLLEKIGEGTQEGIESALRVPINKKWTLVGTDDHYNEDLCKIVDWKMTSVWSVVFGDHDWEEQLNCYAWMRRQLGYDVKKIEVWALLRDWQMYKAKYGGDKSYPKIPFVRCELKLWSVEKQEKYILSRIRKFTKRPEACSDREKWQDRPKWKVMKQGRKSALIASTYKDGNRIDLLSSEDALNAAQAKNIPVDGKKVYLQEFPSEPKRCLLYCDVSEFCPDYVEAQNV